MGMLTTTLLVVTSAMILAEDIDTRNVPTTTVIEAPAPAPNTTGATLQKETAPKPGPLRKTKNEERRTAVTPES